MTDTDIHSCGYYCDRPACIKAQRNELRDKLFGEQWVKTYSGGKPNYTEPCERCGEVNPAEIHTCTPKQPEQEPVAWGFQNTGITGSNRWMYLRETIPTDDQYRGVFWMPLYTAPPQREWVGLTDEELLDIADMAYANDLELLQTLQAKLKEKNSTSVMNQQTSDKND